jgi:hypothetical protein
MSDSPISTSSECGQTVSTAPIIGETAGQWMRRHMGAVNDAITAGTFTLGDELCTQWLDAQGTSQSVCSDRLPGESDAAFKTRHFADAATAMVDNPPVP